MDWSIARLPPSTIFDGTHAPGWRARGTVTVKHLAKEYNTISQAKARNRTALYMDQKVCLSLVKKYQSVCAVALKTENEF